MILELRKNDFEKMKEIEEKFPDIFNNNSIKIDYESNPYTNYLIYTIEDKVVGFINYYDIYERIEIVNFNVLPFFQNKHIGSNLLNNLITYSLNNNKKNISLEVRKDNDKAVSLYEKHGFKKVAIRPNYYNGVDGILMEKELFE